MTLPKIPLDLATDPQIVILLGMIITGIATIVGAIVGSLSMVKKSMIDYNSAKETAEINSEQHEQDLVANAPAREASTSEVISNTMKTALDSLRRDIELRDTQREREKKEELARQQQFENRINELTIILTERDSARIKEREEELIYRKELVDKIDLLTGKLEEALTGIAILTNQLTLAQIVPQYPPNPPNPPNQPC